MATLKQIAEKTNVSITTVSRVLNNDKTLSVGDEIRKNIIKTARDMQYKTPRNRTRLKSSKELHIGVVLWYDVKQEMEDPYYMQIRMGIERLAQQSNIKVSVLYKENDTYTFKEEHFDGLILVGKFSKKSISYFESISTSLVFVDSSPQKNKYDSVVIDFEQSVKSIVDYLINHGYTSIGYIGGVEEVDGNVFLGERREMVFREYLKQKNILQEEHIHIGRFTSESGYTLMKQALDNDIAEVYFCGNDHIATGALRAMLETGLTVPRDVGVFGFNNGPQSEYTFPPLSTMNVPTEHMGQQALISCIELIEGRVLNIKKVVPTNIVERQSVK